jgi:hypothetical protein
VSRIALGTGLSTSSRWSWYRGVLMDGPGRGARATVVVRRSLALAMPRVVDWYLNSAWLPGAAGFDSLREVVLG